MSIDPLLEGLATPRPDLAEMVDQVRQRIRQRTDTVAMTALTEDPEWKRVLAVSLGSGASGQLIRDVALFRDRWGISDSPLPLGATPADYEWEQRDQREKLQVMIDGARNCPIAPQRETSSLNMPLSQQVVLTRAGWQL